MTDADRRPAGVPTLEEAVAALAEVRGGVEVTADSRLRDIDLDSLDVFEWLMVLGLGDEAVDDEALGALLEDGTVAELYHALCEGPGGPA